MAASRLQPDFSFSHLAASSDWRLTPVAGAIALIVIGQLSASVAWAQNASEKTLAPVSVTGNRNESQGYTPGIASTGSKIAVPLKDLPSSVVVIPKEVIEEQASKTLNQVLTNASGVQPVYGGGYGFADSYVIRGLRIRLLRDGVADGPALINYSRSFADVESVEVLKGPGSAVYGSGAPGGVINLTSKQPSRTFGANVEATAGSLGLRQVVGDLTGAITDDLSGRLIVNDYHTDGIRGLKADVREIVGKLDYRLNASNRFSIGYDHRENKNVVDNFGIFFDVNGSIANVSKDTKYYSPFNQVSQTIDRFTLVHDYTASNDVSLRTAFSYDKRKIDIIRNAGSNVINAANAITGRNGRTQSDDANYTNLSSELTWKLQGPIKQTVLLGAEYEIVRNTANRFTYALPNITNALAPIVPETTLAGLPQVRAFDKKIGSNTFSTYAQDQIEFSKEWKARAGVRLDQVRYFDDGIGNSLTVPTVANVYRKLEVTQNLPSWQAGLVYQPSSDLSFFVGATQGRFISVQTESINLDKSSEKSRQVELGAKTSWLNDKLNVNFTYFQTQRNNYLTALSPGTDPLPVGQSKSKGFELDVIGAPLPGWNITAAFSQVNARSTGSELVVINGITTAAGESVNGKFLAATPKTSAAIWNSWRVQEGALKGLGIGFGIVNKGSSYADTLEKLKVPGYTIYNASVSYKFGKGDKTELALNIKNLTNKSYYSVPTFSGALPGETRQALLTLRTAF